MSLGRVYVWTSDSVGKPGGCVTKSIVPLLRLDDDGEGRNRLWGRYVRVRNGGAINVLDPATGMIQGHAIGDAQPDEDNNYLFEPERGGGRVDNVAYVKTRRRWRYVEAAHFGEVNTYFHLDYIAAYVDELLHELGSQPLPRVIAVVNAHHAATEVDGVRDGLRRGERWLPFQGGHYRLPGRRYDMHEYEPISPDGEIHLGPGRQMLEDGALVEAEGSHYRAIASHNAGIIYHEYGHHITRHTADFKANGLRRPDCQKNVKTALDEGFCDYWAATLLNTPHIWAWHHRHDDEKIHPRSLASSTTMSDYDPDPGADPHTNGTIWAAALWDLRTQLKIVGQEGVRLTDMLVLKTLLLLGQLLDHAHEGSTKEINLLRESFGVGLTALLQADELLNAGSHRDVILASFVARGIQPDQSIETDRDGRLCINPKSA